MSAAPVQARGFATRERRTTPTCPRCNERAKEIEVVIQGRYARRPNPGSVATRSRRLCEPCALDVFTQMEAILDGGKP